MGSRRHFCCCIPVRAAVFIASLLSLIGSALGAGAFFWLVHTVDTRPDLLNDNQVKITSGARIGLIVAGVVLAIIAIISLFGFIGSVIRNRRMVKTYSVLVWVGFFSSLALTAFAFYLVFSKSRKRRDCCPKRRLFDSPVTREGRAARVTVPGVWTGSRTPENSRLRWACRCLLE
jgi:uncharacterized membrane protein YbhN (UPF0104 family)